MPKDIRGESGDERREHGIFVPGRGGPKAWLVDDMGNAQGSQHLAQLARGRDAAVVDDALISGEILEDAAVEPERKPGVVKEHDRVLRQLLVERALGCEVFVEAGLGVSLAARAQERKRLIDAAEALVDQDVAAPDDLKPEQGDHSHAGQETKLPSANDDGCGNGREQGDAGLGVARDGVEHTPGNDGSYRHGRA